MRVLLADDHEVVREGLRSLLESQADIEVVGYAEDGASAVQEAHRLNPDLVIMDITMPGMNGIDATREVVAGCPRTRVLCLSVHRNIPCVRAVFDAGASGYVLKDCAGRELIAAARSVAEGSMYVSPNISNAALDSYYAD
ncbi:MAG: response regulator transcription factor [Candidatus Pacebacteria bacterium]|nr:response regulator transcription factor [Candidatus Paceibacterota bacterium]